MRGADGLVMLTISWMASRSFSRCSGLLMPISRWISWSDRADMMAPLLTLARHAATYHAGIPSHSWAYTKQPIPSIWNDLHSVLQPTTGLQINEDQSNLAKSGIAHCRSIFARWWHRTDGLAAICMFCQGVDCPNLPFHWGSGTQSNTKCICQMASKSVEWFKQDARVWQTTHDRLGLGKTKMKTILSVATADSNKGISLSCKWIFTSHYHASLCIPLHPMTY